MKKNRLLLFCALILLLLPAQAAAGFCLSARQDPPFSFSEVVSVSRERALEQRAGKVVEINDALIQRTIQANGVNYFHQGKSNILIFNHKIYQDFTIRVMGGSRLIIETEDGAIQMDVVNP